MAALARDLILEGLKRLGKKRKNEILAVALPDMAVVHGREIGFSGPRHDHGADISIIPS